MGNTIGSRMHTGNLHAGGDNKLAMIYGSNSQIDQSSHQHHDYSTHHHASGFQDFIAFCKAVIQDNKVLSIVAIGALFYTGKRLYNWQQADVAIVNLSEPVEHFILRHIELQRLQQRFQRQTTAIKEAAIVGITGAGKSELGKAYARAYRDSWFHPQKAYYLKKPLIYVLNGHRLLNDYEDLAEALGISFAKLAKNLEKRLTYIQATYENKRAIHQKALIDKVNEALRDHPGWLLIFDDIEDIDSVRKFYPHGGGLNGSVLYTTQDTSALDKALRVDLSDGLAKEDACYLLTELTKLPISNDTYQLITALDSLPLALMVAGLFIHHQRQYQQTKGSDYASYLTLHQEALEDLELHQKAVYKQHASRQAKELTQQAALQISLSTLTDNQLALLRFISLLAQQPVSEELLLAYAKQYDPQVEPYSAIKGLRQRGLLQRKSAQTKKWTIHQQTRRVVQLGMLPADRFKLVATALTVLSDETYASEKAQSLAWKKTNLPHAMALFEVLTDQDLEGGLREAIIECYGLWGIYALHLDEAALAKSLLEKVLLWQEQDHGPDHPKVAITLNSLANAYSALGQPQQQKKLLKRALSIFEKQYDPNPTQVAIILASLASAYGALGQPQQQKKLLKRALPIFEKRYGPNHIKVATILNNLASAYGTLWQPLQQKALSERALPIFEKYYGKGHPYVAIPLANLANAYGALGQSQQKKELLERALAIEESYYDKDHPRVAKILISLANAYGALGQPLQQKKLSERALPIFEKYCGKNHLYVATTLANLASAYSDLGQPLQQKELLERALPMYENHYGQDHPGTAIALKLLADSYTDLGHPQQAIPLLQQAATLEKQHYGNKHFILAETLALTGKAYTHLGQTDCALLALLFLHDALAAQAAYYQQQRPAIMAKTYRYLAEAQQLTGNFAEARSNFEQAKAILEQNGFSNDHLEMRKILDGLKACLQPMSSIVDAPTLFRPITHSQQSIPMQQTDKERPSSPYKL